MTRHPPRLLLALGCALLAPSVEGQQGSVQERMLLAEDARETGAAGVASFMEGLARPEASIRRQAVRGLGRLEQAELIDVVSAALADPDAGVRAEAYNALGQLARDATAAAAVQSRLLARDSIERDPVALGTLAATLGRLPYGAAADVQRAEAALARVFPEPEGAPRVAPAEAPGPAALAGAAAGLEALVRVSRKVAQLSPATTRKLQAAAQLQGGGAERQHFNRVRRLAWLALTGAGAVDADLVAKAAMDGDEEVRRLAMAAVASDSPLGRREALLETGLRDANARVRYEALRAWGRHSQKTSCAPIVAALRDGSPHVALLAIDLLGSGCPADSPATTLRALAEVVTPRPNEWHRAAHALVSLAKVAPVEARTLLPRYVDHPVWQVRMYAAHAAGVLEAGDALGTLGRDAHDNVRQAALEAMLVLKRPEAGSFALDALTRRDYQLLLSAARAIGAGASAPGPPASSEAVTALSEALKRVTAEGRETSRDPRLAMLDALKALGGPEGAGAGPGARGVVASLLRDFDPAVARKAAEILEGWAAGPQKAAPEPRPKPGVSLAAVTALRDTRLRFVISGRGVFELRLLVDEAPLSVLRVATRAREGYYDGLTFHRVAANFVIQGGSPGANEYMGDGPFMRDEVGRLAHERGTVGISTRGRDTGDAQIFVNLVDSPRLNHTYTVLADVVHGLEVVDAVLEGDVIERVEIVGPAAR